MSGIANFGGKKAAPFGKGGKRRKVTAAKKAIAKAALKKGADLSNLDAAERKALKPSDFVFPATREFPIPDKAHALAALRLSGRVPAKAAVVRAAVYKRYPELKPTTQD